MLRVTDSFPNQCPDCNTPVSNSQPGLLWETSGNFLVCSECGITIVIRESDDEEEESEQQEAAVSAISCPHCCTVGEIQIAGGSEWCSSCGLDPSRRDLPAKSLLRLWKSESGIQKLMMRDIPRSTESRLYEFLTNFCGPHCSLAKSCPQATKNLARCYHEEVLDNDDAALLTSLKNRTKNAGEKEKSRILGKKERAVLQCAPSGWYARNLKPKNETENL